MNTTNTPGSSPDFATLSRAHSRHASAMGALFSLLAEKEDEAAEKYNRLALRFDELAPGTCQGALIEEFSRLTSQHSDEVVQISERTIALLKQWRESL